MKKILYILKKEFLQYRRDRKMIGMSTLAPVLQLIILGYAANLDVNQIPMLVCDLDRTQASRNLVQNFTSSGYFESVGLVGRMQEIDPLIERGAASVAIVIPKGFSADLNGGRSAQVQLIVDGSESNSATVGLNYAAVIATRFSQNVLLERLQRSGAGVRIPARIDPEVRVWYNPDLKSRNFMVPGVLGLLLMVMTLILTSLAIVKEKEIGTLEQLVVTPIKPHELIIGKLSLFTIIGMVDVLLVVVVSTFFFGVPVRGSVAELFVLCMVFLLTTLGLGLFVSTVSRTQQQAMMSAIFFVMMPMIFFSGFVFPIENMPQIIQWFSYLLPLRYFFVIIRGIFLKGIGLDVLWPQALALLAFGVAILGLSALRFQKRLG